MASNARKDFFQHSTAGPYRLGSIYRFALLAMLGLVLTACKIVVTVPAGGKVVSEDGFECLAGQTCEIEVTNENFDSTFTAIPAQGYTFTRWRPKPASFCGHAKTPCHLSTTGFGGNEALQGFLDSDQPFFLEPVFVRFNLSYWQKVLKEIEKGTFATNGFLYSALPDVANCDPGSTTVAAQNRTLKAVNETRSIHRLPAVEYDDFYNRMQQSTSLVQIANNYLSHNPQPGDTCYTQRSNTGAASSNLGAAGGNKSVDPVSDVFGWINDNDNIAAVMEAGHRRWMLFPELGYVTYGQVFGFSALKVNGFGVPIPNPVPNDLEFVAMPYEAYPYVLVTRNGSLTPWSLSMVPPSGMDSNFNYFQNATVSVTNNDSGKSLKINNLNKDNKGFGLANFLSWMVAGWNYDTPYTVKVSGIRMPGGDVKDLEYPVMVDRYDLLNLNFPLEASDQGQQNKLDGAFNSPTDADSYTMSLNGTKTISGTSNFSNQAFYIRVYDSGKNLVKSSDKAFTQKFGFGKHTIVISPCNESGGCYQGTKTYEVTIN
jgi:hypothetical protein